MGTVISTEAHHYWPSARTPKYFHLWFSVCDYRMSLVSLLYVYCCWWFCYLSGRCIWRERCSEIIRNFEEVAHWNTKSKDWAYSPHFCDNGSILLHPTFQHVTSRNLMFQAASWKSEVWLTCSKWKRVTTQSTWKITGYARRLKTTRTSDNTLDTETRSSGRFAATIHRRKLLSTRNIINASRELSNFINASHPQ